MKKKIILSADLCCQNAPQEICMFHAPKMLNEFNLSKLRLQKLKSIFAVPSSGGHLSGLTLAKHEDMNSINKKNHPVQ